MHDPLDPLDPMNRRAFGKTLGTSLAGAALSAPALTALQALAAARLPAQPPAHVTPGAGPAGTPASMPLHGGPTGRPPVEIAMLLYPGFTPLDLIGPHYALQFIPDARIHLVAASRAPVVCESGFAFVPTVSYAECPRDLTVLFVPGSGRGLLGALGDPALLDFVADRGRRAHWVTSVCTGSVVLGAAGLLRGYRATSHWLLRDALRAVGATPVDQRVVDDRNRITGAGVSAGLDFGLALTARLAGRPTAEAAQLMAEYDPQPPFHAGSPAQAGPQATTMMRGMHARFVADAAHAAAAAYHARGAAS